MAESCDHGQKPSWLKIVGLIIGGISALGIAAKGIYFLMDQRISEKTEILDYRLSRVENAIRWQPSFVTIEVEKDGKTK